MTRPRHRAAGETGHAINPGAFDVGVALGARRGRASDCAEPRSQQPVVISYLVKKNRR